MTKLPDVITIPAAPRDARAMPPSDAGEDSGAFDELMRQAAGAEEEESDSPQPKAPRGGAPASADGALAAVIPWLAPAPQPSPSPETGLPAAGIPVIAAGDGEPATPAPASTPDLTELQPPTITASGTGLPSGHKDQIAPQAAGTPVLANAAPPGDGQQPPVPSSVPPTHLAGNGATQADSPLPAGTTAKSDVASADAGKAEPTAPRPSMADTTGAQGGAGQNAGGQGSGNGQRPPVGEVAAGATAQAGSVAAGGVEALPPLPAQAASNYAATVSHTAAATHPPTPAAQVAAPLVRVANAGGGEFHIDLSPPDLGPVRVVAEVSDGTVTLTVKAESSEALSLLRRDMHQLERALGDAGLKLDTASLQFSLQGDGQPRHFAAHSHDEGSRKQAGWLAEAEAADADPQPERAPRPIDGVVDISV